jgi:2-amino-4-hydroxy-6-hydroxymethyldihydropteridine diphosphokinase
MAGSLRTSDAVKGGGEARGQTAQSYLIALGSNRRHYRHGLPPHVVEAAMTDLERLGRIEARSAIEHSAPIGPARRRFANAACLLACAAEPPALLDELKAIERAFGRRRGQRWGDRVLDLDIVLWSGGIFAGPNLSIPHRAFRTRAFVLGPARAIAPCWRDPITGLTIRQLHARLTTRRPLPREHPRLAPGP